MNKIYEPLFTPWKIRDVEIKNRIVLCPMGGTSLFGWMEPHHLDEDAANFFLERAKHDVGLIIPGIAPLRNLIGGQWLYKAKGAFRKLNPIWKRSIRPGLNFSCSSRRASGVRSRSAIFSRCPYATNSWARS